MLLQLWSAAVAASGLARGGRAAPGRYGWAWGNPSGDPCLIRRDASQERDASGGRLSCQHAGARLQGQRRRVGAGLAAGVRDRLPRAVRRFRSSGEQMGKGPACTGEHTRAAGDGSGGTGGGRAARSEALLSLTRLDAFREQRQRAGGFLVRVLARAKIPALVVLSRWRICEGKAQAAKCMSWQNACIAAFACSERCKCCFHFYVS